MNYEFETETSEGHKIVVDFDYTPGEDPGCDPSVSINSIFAPDELRDISKAISKKSYQAIEEECLATVERREA